MLLKLSRKIAQMTVASSIRLYSSNQSVKLAYNVYEKHSDSKKTDLIVLHGLFGSKSNWNSLSKAFNFKMSRKVFAIDARNHGDSPHANHHSYELMASDIEQFYDDLQLHKASIIGHSMGGRAVMYFALTNPELVEKLIVVDISPVSPIGTSQTNIPLFLEAMRSIQIPKDLTIHQGRKQADQELSKIIEEQSLRNFLITNLMKTESGEFSWRINIETLAKEFDGNINKFPDCTGLKFPGPTLFIGGERSDYIKKKDFPEIKKLFPNSELVYVKDCGHWVHSEKPEDFLKLVVNFLET